MSIFKNGEGELLFRLPEKARPKESFAGPAGDHGAIVIHSNGDVRYLDILKEGEG